MNHALIKPTNLIDAVGETVITQTSTGIIIGWNKEAELQCGYLANEVINQSIFIIIISIQIIILAYFSKLM